jgi:peptidyl-prolyl cis-trans isomerase D
MQQLFANPQTGQYDVNTAKKQFEAIKNRPNDPQVQNFNEAYIDPAIMQRKAEKYQSLISGAVYVPKWMSEKMNADANSVAKASYVYVPYNSIVDSTIKVSDEEMETYIQKHVKQYERDDETRTISYVSFSGAPTTADSQSVRNDLNLLKNEFVASSDEKTFLSSKGNEAPYYNSFIGGKEIKQAIKDTLFQLSSGCDLWPLRRWR